MIRNPREQKVLTQEEGGMSCDKSPKGNSRRWSKLQNPRIVRVSRLFGGKDRHSKVSTIRGLRDRRVRLSLPTAIQVYGLQEKLGLNQPSKVIDWLLNAAEHEINKLPPLPHGNFGQFPQGGAISRENIQTSTLSCSGIMTSEEENRRLLSLMNNGMSYSNHSWKTSSAHQSDQFEVNQNYHSTSEQFPLYSVPVSNAVMPVVFGDTSMCPISASCIDNDCENL